METWIQDVRFGARALWRHANITTLCIVAIALGIGANAAVFTLINEILLRPLPVHEPSRLIDLHVDQPGANSFVGFSYPEFEELRAANALAGLAAHSGVGLRLGASSSDIRAAGQLSSTGWSRSISRWTRSRTQRKRYRK